MSHSCCNSACGAGIVPRVIRVALVLVVVGCGSTDELEKKVTKLEGDVALLRKEREFLELKQVQLLKEVSELRAKIDEQKRYPPPSPPYRPTRRQPDPRVTYSLELDALDPIEGPADALVTIVEGYEYACPFCERVRTTLDDVKKRYGKDVRWVGKQIVVHPQNATAAALAICAAHKQQKFSAMDRLLWEEGFKARNFDKVNCWDDSAGCPAVDGFAKQLGLNMKKFRADMTDDCQAWQRKNQAALARIGATATPSFYINGRYLSGAQPVEKFAELIDEELAKAKARVQQGTPRAGYYDKWIVEEGEPDLGP
jgi:protein-disulfide isomerase